MSKHRDDVVLKDIANAAHLVVEFIEGYKKETFTDDWKTRSAVLYQFRTFAYAGEKA
jgi:uncharacterized protein with HEPN domain